MAETIFDRPTMTITDSTISGNTATATHSEDTIEFKVFTDTEESAGGANFLMGDGSVVFIVESVEAMADADDPVELDAVEASVPTDEITMNYADIDW